MNELEAPIRDVTVYADRALITRQGTIHLEAGEHEIRVNNLPQFLRESLRASGQGPQGTRILNVDISTAFYSRPPEAEIIRLLDEMEQLRQKDQLLKARQSALEDRRKWLRALGEQSRDFARGLAQGQMRPQDCADFFSFTSTQALQDAEAAQTLELEIKQVKQDIEAKKRELTQKQGGNTLPDRLAAVIALELPQAGDFSLELSYIVMNASWYPQYDIRVLMNAEGNDGEVELTYMGMVQQYTGEAWENVNLALSTARPSLAAVLPELDPWYLNASMPPPPAPMARALSAPGSAGAPRQRAMKTKAYTEAAEEIDYADYEESAVDAAYFAAAAPTSVAAEVATASVERTGTSLVFRVGRSVDIPSDSTPHKTTIARDNLPCEFDYVSAPALEEYAHLHAEVTNISERVLLTGDASIFLGGDYVGTTQVKMTAPNEKFDMFLGIDDSIKVKRELIERAVDKGNLLQSDLRRSTYAYRITIHNYANYPRRIIVRDHLPVSKHERVKVKVQQIQPAPSERSKLEILKWKFTLPADGEQKLDYRFTAEHPQNLRVTGLP